MSRKNVPIKTDKGTLEIKARILNLAPRIRTALLLVDGVKSTAELERLMAAAGVTAGALQLLLDKGLICFPEDEGRGGLPNDAGSGKVVPGKAMSEAKGKSDKAVTASAALEVAPIKDLETILEVATKLEMETILGVATLLELTPTLALAPMAATIASDIKPIPLPLAQAERNKHPAAALQKTVVPASVLRMNVVVARAHLANALDQFVGIDGYLLKQKVVACESRSDLERLFRVVEDALIQKLDKPAAARIVEIAQARLARS
jgi:hypothetical protein